MAGKGINRGLQNGGASFFDDSNIIAAPPFRHWLNRLSALYSSVFTYENMPPTVNMVEAEKWLTDYGMICMYPIEEIGGLVCLPSQDGGRINAYGMPTRINAFGLNGFTDFVDINNAAICYDNIGHTPPRYDLAYYSHRLGEMDITIDVNTTNQRTPYIFRVTKEQELTMRNVNKQIQDGNLTVYMRKTKNEEIEPGIIQTPAVYVADKIQIQKDALIREIANFMGVFSGTTLKAERMTSGENASNVGFIRSARGSRYNQRVKFCEMINSKFANYLEGEVKVKYSEETVEEIAAGLIQIGANNYEGGAENGKIYY